MTSKKGKKNRRQWTEPEKVRLLEEAARTSVHGTAARNKLNASQLFVWRKQLKGHVLTTR